MSKVAKMMTRCAFATRFPRAVAAALALPMAGVLSRYGDDCVGAARR